MNASSILRGRLLGSMLLTLVFLTFLGHIAPLVSSAHSPFTAPATTHEQSEGDSEASHVASCDAVFSRPALLFSGAGDEALPTVLPTPRVALPVPTVVSTAMVRPGRADAGPLLFLLHASFLI